MPSKAQLIQTDAPGRCNELSGSLFFFFNCKALKLDPAEQAIGKKIKNIVKK